MSTSKRTRLPAVQWSDRMHHVFYTIVLPTVFEWCALSDFFMPDELFHAYAKEKNGCITTRGPFSVAHAVCKDWFAALYKRIAAHHLRLNFDMRVLQNDTGGILKDNHVMVRNWSTASLHNYLKKGGTPLADAYSSGVELIMTIEHLLLHEKKDSFLDTAIRILKPKNPTYDLIDNYMELRRVQIINHCVSRELNYYGHNLLTSYTLFGPTWSSSYIIREKNI